MLKKFDVDSFANIELSIKLCKVFKNLLNKKGDSLITAQTARKIKSKHYYVPLKNICVQNKKL